MDKKNWILSSELQWSINLLKTILKNSRGNDGGSSTSNEQIINYDIHFRGIFSEPHLIEGYDIENDDYPCPPEYISKITENILTKEMNAVLGTPFDGIADESDTTKIYGNAGKQKVQE